MTDKERLAFKWEKDTTADGYIIEQKRDTEFLELVRVENTDLTSIIVPDVKKNEENHFRVSYYKKQNGMYHIYRKEEYYCFSTGKSSIIYRLPFPRLKKAKRNNESVIVSWEKVESEVTYLVIKKIAGGNWERVGITKKTNYIDEDVEAGKKYRYSVRCVSENGEKKLSGCFLPGVLV